MNTCEFTGVSAVFMSSVVLSMIGGAAMAGRPVAGAEAPPSTEPTPDGPTEAAAAYAGLMSWLDEHRGVVYHDEDSLAVDACPLVDGARFEAEMAASPLAAGFEAAGASITTHLMSELFDDLVLDDGDLIEPVGVRCDFAPIGNDARVDFVDLFAVDVGRDEFADLLLAGAEAGADLDIWSTRRAPGDLPGTIFSGCLAGSDPGRRCFEAWAHRDLVIVMYVGVDSSDDLALVGPRFDAVLPVVVQTLAGDAPETALLAVPESSPAYDGLVSWLARFDGLVYTGEDSLDIGPCPLVDAAGFNGAVATAASGTSFEASSAAVTTHFLSETWYEDAVEEGDVIVPVGMRCDFTPVDGEATGIEFADVIAVDSSRDRFVRWLLDMVEDGGFSSIDRRPSPAGLPGAVYGGCLGFPDACIQAWVAGDLVVALYVGPEPDDHSLELAGAFDSMLPGIVLSLASLQE